MPIIGAHVSAAGGVENALVRGEELGVQAIQMFGSSPRQWNVNIPSAETIQRWNKTKEKSSVREVFLHAPYLCNIAHPDEELRAKSVQALGDHLKIAHLLDTQGLIFHIGTGKGSNRQEVYRLIATGVHAMLDHVGGSTPLIIENSAGEGDKIGASIQEIGQIFDLISSPRVGVCIDTAHAFASGMIEEYTEAGLTKFFDEYDRVLGHKTLRALHVNDSKIPALGKKDRHENIGEGYIGIDGFRALAREKRVGSIAWLLEVPGFDNAGPDKRNVELLRSCFSSNKKNCV